MSTLTESRNPNTMNLDTMSALEIVTVMNEEDKKVPEAIGEILPDIAKAAELVAHAFKNQGRLIYIGAGTSGRLGVIDASECPPTFGTDPSQVVGLIAGGDHALRNAIEGAEDRPELGKQDLISISLTDKDVVVGIAASGRTPYVLGALTYAKEIGAKTIAIACNKGSKIGAIADIALEVTPGPEVVTGSTRLKAGTCQKLILNMISTTAMVLDGKVYQNLMVNMHQSNEKLKKRAETMVMEATGVDEQTAVITLNEADRDIKLAIVMILTGLDKETSKQLLLNHQGHIQKAVKSV